MLKTESVPQQIWDHITNKTEVLPTIPALVLIAVLVAVVSYRPTWTIVRNVVTIAHEGAHAFVAMLVGRKLQSITLHSDTSGLTVSRGKPRGFGMILTASAGYIGPAVVGLIGAYVVSRGYALGWIWVFVAVLVLMLFKVRNLFGAWSLVATAAILGAGAWFADESMRTYIAYALVWLFLAGSPKAVVELSITRRRTRSGTSDADILGKLSWFPASFWVFVFFIVTVACAVTGLWLLVPELFSFLA